MPKRLQLNFSSEIKPKPKGFLRRKVGGSLDGISTHRQLSEGQIMAGDVKRHNISVSEHSRPKKIIRPPIMTRRSPNRRTSTRPKKVQTTPGVPRDISLPQPDGVRGSARQVQHSKNQSPLPEKKWKMKMPILLSLIKKNGQSNSPKDKLVRVPACQNGSLDKSVVRKVTRSQSNLIMLAGSEERDDLKQFFDKSGTISVDSFFYRNNGGAFQVKPDTNWRGCQGIVAWSNGIIERATTSLSKFQVGIKTWSQGAVAVTTTPVVQGWRRVRAEASSCNTPCQDGRCVGPTLDTSALEVTNNGYGFIEVDKEAETTVSPLPSKGSEWFSLGSRKLNETQDDKPKFTSQLGQVVEESSWSSGSTSSSNSTPRPSSPIETEEYEVVYDGPTTKRKGLSFLRQQRQAKRERSTPWNDAASRVSRASRASKALQDQKVELQKIGIFVFE